MANINDPKIREKYLKKITIPDEVQEKAKAQEQQAHYRNYDDNVIEKLRERAKLAREKEEAAFQSENTDSQSIGATPVEISPPAYAEPVKSTEVVIVSPPTVLTSEGFYDEFTLQLNTLSVIQKTLFDYIYSLCENKNFEESPLIRANDLAVALGLKKISVIKGFMYLENKHLVKIEETRRGRGGFIKLSIPESTITRIKQLKAS